MSDCPHYDQLRETWHIDISKSSKSRTMVFANGYCKYSHPILKEICPSLANVWFTNTVAFPSDAARSDVWLCKEGNLGLNENSRDKMEELDMPGATFYGKLNLGMCYIKCVSAKQSVGIVSCLFSVLNFIDQQNIY